MPPVNVAFINPFIDAAVTVLTTMAGVASVQRKSLNLKEDVKISGEISGVMGLSGSATGSVAVTLSEAHARALVGGMLGMDGAELDKQEIQDGVGELINMISGHAKNALSGSEYSFSISLPSIIAGIDHEINQKKGTPCIVITMEADGHDFFLQISLAPQDA